MHYLQKFFSVLCTLRTLPKQDENCPFLKECQSILIKDKNYLKNKGNKIQSGAFGLNIRKCVIKCRATKDSPNSSCQPLLSIKIVGVHINSFHILVSLEAILIGCQGSIYGIYFQQRLQLKGDQVEGSIKHYALKRSCSSFYETILEAFNAKTHASVRISYNIFCLFRSYNRSYI